MWEVALVSFFYIRIHHRSHPIGGREQIIRSAAVLGQLALPLFCLLAIISRPIDVNVSMKVLGVYIGCMVLLLYIPIAIGSFVINRWLKKRKERSVVEALGEKHSA